MIECALDFFCKVKNRMMERKYNMYVLMYVDVDIVNALYHEIESYPKEEYHKRYSSYYWCIFS